MAELEVLSLFNHHSNKRGIYDPYVYIYIYTYIHISVNKINEEDRGLFIEPNRLNCIGAVAQPCLEVRLMTYAGVQVCAQPLKRGDSLDFTVAVPAKPAQLRQFAGLLECLRRLC